MPFKGDAGNVAAAGLQGGWDALAQLIAERKKDELLRYTQEQDRLQFQQTQARMDETSKWQQLQFEAQEQHRREQLAHQQKELALRTEAEKRLAANTLADNLRAKWDKTAGGTVATPQEFIEATQKSDVARGAFTPTNIPIDPSTGVAHEGIPQGFRYEGGAAWRTAQENRLLREKAMQQPQMVMQKVTVNGPNGPQEVLMYVDKRAGQHGDIVDATPSPPVGQQTKAIEAGIALQDLNTIRSTYKPEYVGALGQGIVSTLADRFGYTADISKLFSGQAGGELKKIDPQFATFAAALNRNRNRKIKAITGAAVGGPEEQERLKGEIPWFTNSEEKFLANLEGDSNLEARLVSMVKERQLYGLDTPGVRLGANGELVVEGFDNVPAATRGAPVVRPTRTPGGGKVRRWGKDANGNLVPLE